MDFGFSEEQQAVRETARRFAGERVRPGYAAREAAGRLEPELLREMGALGLIGAELPEELGGAGLDGVTTGIIVEEISKADLNVAYVQVLHSLNGAILATHAAPDLAREMVPRMLRGEFLVALGLTEPGGGSDAANLRLRARADGDHYVLNGEKSSISMADQSAYAVIFARTGTQEERARGVTAFLVPLDAPGASTSRFDDLGSNAVGRGSIFLDDVRVPAGWRLGAEGQGFRQVMNGFDYSRALIGLQVLAAAAASLAETWAYVTERQAFGGPIARFQGVTEPLAEAETMLEAARLLCYRTLWLRDRGEKHTAEAAMCKWWCPKVAFDVIHACLLTHGQMGYSRDMAHQQRLREVLGLQIGDGTAQIQKMVIARERIGRVAVPY